MGWVAVALGGWLWGSFLNQCVDRLGAAGTAAPAAGGGISLLRPARSVCLGCGARIAWYDNLPILSYLLLRGRCRHCGAPIGRRTLILEIATPLIGLGIFALWDWGLAFAGAALAASWTLVAVPMRLEGRAWSVGWTWLGVALWTVFFWSATLGRLASG